MAPDRKTRDTASITLSAEERSWMLKYGIPGSELAEDLRALQDDPRDRSVSIDRFDLDPVIGELSHATNHAEDDRLIEDLDGLCVRLELLEKRFEPLRP